MATAAAADTEVDGETTTMHLVATVVMTTTGQAADTEAAAMEVVAITAVVAEVDTEDVAAAVVATVEIRMTGAKAVGKGAIL